MFVIGDKVQVVDYKVKKHIGRNGTVIAIYKRLTEPLPNTKRTKEIHYRVRMIGETKIQHVREQQLRKL